MIVDDEMRYSDFAIMVVSCDKYEDVWEMCSQSLKTFWKDHPEEVVLVTECKQAADDMVFSKTINVDSECWTKRINTAVKKLQNEYIFFMLEDQFPVSDVDERIIEEAILYMKNNPNVAIIYMETEGEDGVKASKRTDNFYNEIPFGAPYRISVAPCIIRRSFLEKITEKDSDPWVFEKKAAYEPIGEAVRILEFRNTQWIRIASPGAIWRGKWVNEVKTFASGINIEIKGDRKYLSLIDRALFAIEALVFNAAPKNIIGIQNKLSK